jgi:threonine dehydrogenase-like Zn-dependent dehydrogenase
MRALCFDKELKLMPVFPMPPKKTGEALVKVLLAGICGTDIEVINGYRNFHGILGHEFVGIVQDANDQKLIGKRVVSEINIGCGECPLCRKGIKEHCKKRKVIGIEGHDGCFADYIAVPEANLHIIPDDIGNDKALFIEPLAAAFSIVNGTWIKPTDRVAVIGDGTIGILSAQVIKITGADVCVIGKHKKKLSILEWMGIDTFTFLGQDEKGVHVRSSNGAEKCMPSHHFDVVVECSGSPRGIDMARFLVVPRGTIVIKTTVKDGVSLDLTFAVIHEVHVVGSRCGPFQPAIRALRKGLVEVRPLITGRFPFEDWQGAMQMIKKPDSLKVVFEINQT